MLVKKIEVLFFWKKNESFSHVLTESIWLFYLKDFFLYSHYVDFTDDFFSVRALQIQFSMHVQNSVQNYVYFLPLKK